MYLFIYSNGFSTKLALFFAILIAWGERSRREHSMSLFQVVQGHRAQCTLVDRSLGIHRSFLFPDLVQAALPRGA